MMNKKKITMSIISAYCLLTTNLAIAAAPAGWGAPPKPGGVPTDLEDALMNLINWILGFVSMVAVLMVIYGGIQYLASAGDESKAESGKKTLTYAFMGLVICGLAYGIVEVIVINLG
ncbi:MAG: pilin [Patescibacteria group bacterium]|nr:pilin [Patescibacteria group bacterium]